MLIKRSTLSLETALFKGLLSLLSNSLSAKDELVCVYWTLCKVCICVRLKELLLAFLNMCFCFGGAQQSLDLWWHSSPSSSSSVSTKNGVANHRSSHRSSHVGNLFHVDLILHFYLSRCPSHLQLCVWWREDTWSPWSCLTSSCLLLVPISLASSFNDTW